MTASDVCKFTDMLQSHTELSGLFLHRIYYYDGEPLSAKKPIPLTGGPGIWHQHNFADTELRHANMQLLEELKQKPYFAVRLGETHFRGWLVKPQLLNPENTETSLNLTSEDLIPSIQQKGVDMRIGLDISSLSLKNHVDVIVLVTGDSDFIPAMKFARREGKRIVLFTLGHDVRPEVYAHADICVKSRASELTNTQ